MQLALYQTPESPKRHDYRKQLIAITEAIGDNAFRSLADIEKSLNYRYSQTSISARIRELHRGLLPGWTSEHIKEFGRHFYRVRKV